MDDVRLSLSDAAWQRLGPALLEAKHSHAGAPPKVDDRLFLEALRYLARTGLPWPDLPACFGAWDAVSNRFRRWLAAGVWQRRFAARAGDVTLEPIRRVFVDSTIIRAHPHAAGAPEKKRGQVAQGLGRCRGGFSTKLHRACADERTPVAVLLTPGQDAEVVAFPELWEQVRQQAADVEEAVADKGYDSDAVRRRLIGDDVLPIIPNKVNRVDPWPFVPDIYRERNRVERLVGKLKQFRRVATRYEKLAETFMAMIHLVSAFIVTR